MMLEELANNLSQFYLCLQGEILINDTYISESLSLHMRNKYELQYNSFIRLFQSLKKHLRMFTEIKTRKVWEEMITPHHERKSGDAFEQELIGYNFLRNIWGTYFFDRQEISSEDKIDHINKIVGMMKAQVRLMINHESNLIENQIGKHQHHIPSNQSLQFLQVEHQKTKESLERSKMREEELYTNLLTKQRIIQNLEKQNNQLKTQLFDLKQNKNKCEERVIQLSNKIYDLQRGYILNISGDCSHFEEINNTLDQYSAISIDRQDERERPKVSLFSKRQNISFEFDKTLNDDIRSEQNDSKEKEELSELNLNMPNRYRNPLKQSLQFYNKDKQNHEEIQCKFIEEMKKMKLRTERIMEAENDRFHHHERRKTFAAFTQRPNEHIINQTVNESRRFRRIRC